MVEQQSDVLLFRVMDKVKDFENAFSSVHQNIYDLRSRMESFEREVEVTADAFRNFSLWIASEKLHFESSQDKELALVEIDSNKPSAVGKFHSPLTKDAKIAGGGVDFEDILQRNSREKMSLMSALAKERRKYEQKEGELTAAMHSYEELKAKHMKLLDRVKREAEIENRSKSTLLNSAAKRPRLISQNRTQLSSPPKPQGKQFCSLPFLPAANVQTGVSPHSSNEVGPIDVQNGCLNNKLEKGKVGLPSNDSEAQIQGSHGEPFENLHKNDCQQDRAMAVGNGVESKSQKLPTSYPIMKGIMALAGKEASLPAEGVADMRERKWKSTRKATRKSSTATDSDCHDDFLSTPRELALHAMADSKGGTFSPAEVEHRSRKEDAAAVKPLHSAPCPALPSDNGRREGMKFNSVVRRKQEREALTGVECKQCRKFYDAVMAEDAEGVMGSRCEHHQASSRHRYKYVPPETPAGFWNIGFDSQQ